MKKINQADVRLIRTAVFLWCLACAYVVGMTVLTVQR